MTTAQILGAAKAGGSSGAIQTQGITLPGGWSGLVVIRSGTSGGGDLGPLVAGLDFAPASLPDREQWQRWLCTFLEDPTALPGYQMLKVSKAVEVLHVRFDRQQRPLDLVAKQSRASGGSAGWLNLFRPTRERRNFDRGLDLLRTGMATAMPLTIIERRSPSRQAWLFTEFLPDLVDLDRAVMMELPRKSPKDTRRIKDGLIQVIVDLAVRLNQHHYHHRDFKASNILLANWDGAKGSPEAVLIDLDGLHRSRLRTPARRWRPLVRLAASLDGYSSVTRSDGARFLIAYLKRKSITRQRWRDLYRKLSVQMVSYNRAAKKRKVGKLDQFSA